MKNPERKGKLFVVFQVMGSKDTFFPIWGTPIVL
jgi:hypothetical protein